jgi:hypothetical protein
VSGGEVGVDHCSRHSVVGDGIRTPLATGRGNDRMSPRAVEVCVCGVDESRLSLMQAISLRKGDGKGHALRVHSSSRSWRIEQKDWAASPSFQDFFFPHYSSLFPDLMASALKIEQPTHWRPSDFHIEVFALNQQQQPPRFWAVFLFFWVCQHFSLRWILLTLNFFSSDLIKNLEMDSSFF